MIPVHVASGNHAFDAFALLDSGSNLSLFRFDAARELGIHPRAGRPVLMKGLRGQFTAYVHELEVSAGGKTFVCKIAFSETADVQLNLLGRMDFFEQFVITFDEKNRTVALAA
ncbi:hypothetical protein HY642_01185 [Candidatus Woesearchaeota archaeon]|nr:hypothetical protein [Candidatus Woesearchaeota archaeon]